jgi:hypothetical protein
MCTHRHWQTILVLMPAMPASPTVTTTKITMATISWRPKPSLMKTRPIQTKGDYATAEPCVSAY